MPYDEIHESEKCDERAYTDRSRGSRTVFRTVAGIVAAPSAQTVSSGVTIVHADYPWGTPSASSSL